MKSNQQQIVIGLGSGRCGTLTLAELLDLQPSARFTHEKRPLLPWDSDDIAAVVQQRLARFKEERESFVGDVASFYLPYLEEFIRQEPGIRCIVLKRACEEVVRSFQTWCDMVHVLKIDHWSKKSNEGMSRDPVWSTIFPRFEATSRAEAIQKYWTEYYRMVDQFCQKYPQNVALFDMKDSLGSDVGQRRLLSFIGIEDDQQKTDTSLHLHRSIDPADEQWSKVKEKRSSRSKCGVLVPHRGLISPECAAALNVLEKRGYTVLTFQGWPDLEYARNEMATVALIDGCEETMLIDPEIGFEPDAVEMMRELQLPIVSGVYPKRHLRELAIEYLPGANQMIYGDDGGLQEVLYAATGFMLVRREVYIDIQFQLGLPLCDEMAGSKAIPYFMPMYKKHKDGHRYLDSGYAFCERARQVGYRVMVDTSICPRQVSSFPHTWNDIFEDEIDSFNEWYPPGEVD